MTDLDETVDTWLAAWTEPDDATRLDLIGQVWAAEGKLADPPMTADGHTELSAITG
ncbi:MAG: SnoaL-like protein, partial [Actinomycetia bacterium]|nr:SnoaL-like protein [Actinomycetes bacterium]